VFHDMPGVVNPLVGDVGLYGLLLSRHCRPFRPPSAPSRNLSPSRSLVHARPHGAMGWPPPSRRA
jgi:hypothetical protein